MVRAGIQDSKNARMTPKFRLWAVFSRRKYSEPFVVEWWDALSCLCILSCKGDTSWSTSTPCHRQYPQLLDRNNATRVLPNDRFKHEISLCFSIGCDAMRCDAIQNSPKKGDCLFFFLYSSRRMYDLFLLWHGSNWLGKGIKSCHALFCLLDDDDDDDGSLLSCLLWEREFLVFSRFLVSHLIDCLLMGELSSQDFSPLHHA